MAYSPVALCARALLKIGARPITSFEDGTVEAEVTRNLFPVARDALLSAHPWNFATAQATLPKLVAPPIADYPNAFQLPADFLRALSAGDGDSGRGLIYRIAEGRLHSAADQVVLTYIFRPAEISFPPFFDQVLIARLSADFCLPVTESVNRAEALYKIAEQEFSRARNIDAQQETPGQIEDFTLVGVRS